MIKCIVYIKCILRNRHVVSQMHTSPYQSCFTAVRNDKASQKSTYEISINQLSHTGLLYIWLCCAQRWIKCRRQKLIDVAAMHLRETEFNPQNKDLVAFPIKSCYTPPLLAEAGPRRIGPPPRPGRIKSGRDWSVKKVTALLPGFVQMWRLKRWTQSAIFSFSSPDKWNEKENKRKRVLYHFYWYDSIGCRIWNHKGGPD